MSRKRRQRGYTPVPIPPDYDRPDITIGQAMWFTGLSESAVKRLLGGQPPRVLSYVLGVGARRIVFDSLKEFREACIARGPQFARPLKTGKRKPGRPKRPAAAAAAAAAAE
jgi:hypothetical protein